MSHTQDGFLNELTRMFQSTKNTGSVQISMKRYLAPTEEELKEKDRIHKAALLKQAEANARIAKEKKESNKASNAAKKEGKEAAKAATSGKGKGSGSQKGESKSSTKSSSTKKKKSKKPRDPSKPKKIRLPPTDDSEYVCLIHAKIDGQKASTLVRLKDLTKFHRQLTTVIKAHSGEGLLAKGQTPKPASAKGKNAVGGAKSIAAAKAKKAAKRAAQKARKAAAKAGGQSDTPATATAASTPAASSDSSSSSSNSSNKGGKSSAKGAATPAPTAAAQPAPAAASTPAPAAAKKKGKGK